MKTDVEILKDRSEKNKRESISRFSVSIALLERGVSFLIKTTEFLENIDSKVDQTTPKGASRAATWRFLSTLAGSLIWCAESAQHGYLGISKYLLRLCLEELVSLAFYVEFPQEAFDQMARDAGRDSVDFGEKVSRLKLEHGLGIKKLWGGLSNSYAHANLIIQHEIVKTDKDGVVFFSGGPDFIPDQIEAIHIQLLIILANALKYTLLGFEELYLIDEWRKPFEDFLYDAEVATSKN